MAYIFTRKGIKRTAQVLLAVWIMNILLPLSAHALTSGPSQPEAQSFQPVGTTDMVDLVSGDFKYNIPLLDIDGYPINLNYQSGTGIDDEASWVGLGWNLNVGSITRQVRGIADDFKGDILNTEHTTKPKVTVGGKVTGKVEVRGKLKDGKEVSTPLKVSGSLTFGVFSDNYTGIGAEIGANAGMSFSFANDGMLTAGMGIGVLSNTTSGVDISPNVSMSISVNKNEKFLGNAGLSSSLGYNSRSGMKSLTLGGSLLTYRTSNPLVSYNTEPIQPRIQIPYKTNFRSYSIDLGASATILFVGGGFTGYQSVREVESRNQQHPEYGFLYAESGKNKSNAVQDFIREKENPAIPELPNLAMPIHTPDIFSYNSQTGSGQFRLYRGGTGIFYDNKAVDRSTTRTFGADIGWGFGAHFGVTAFEQFTQNTTQKWTKDNQYLKNGDFQDQSVTAPQKQHVFFKKPDEHNIEDNILTAKLGGVQNVALEIANHTAYSAFKTNTLLSSNVTPVGRIEKEKRQELKTTVSYLTAEESGKAGLDVALKVYPFNDAVNFNPGYVGGAESSPRVDNMRKAHHISELTVLNEQGQRSVYGLPVYNKKQEEISFAVENGLAIRNGIVPMQLNGNGTIANEVNDSDHYLHHDVQPAYASSYLLTGILSPDYVDKTGDGISDDDNGTAIKFKYSKIDTYRWRTPFNSGSSPEASLNRGLLADPKDDKGSIVYGEKEIYYVNAIESKNKIAYFITKDRDDAFGVLDYKGGLDASIKQKCLVEIRLYSKENLSKPIKVVKFDYGYDLCPGTPNSLAPNKGKLTLKKVWFEYGLTHKGENHPYVFEYGSNAAYDVMKTDRWGVYKTTAGNPAGLNNEEYPYSDQDKARADQAVAFWHLSKIELPSGGIINVTYEADDYAYVQDKRAATMVPFNFSNNDITTAHALTVTLDDDLPSGADPLSWFKSVYLNGSDYLYTKSSIKLSTNNANSLGNDLDFVSAYVKIIGITLNGRQATLQMEDINEGDVFSNPIRFAAWQKMKNEYPRYAYPGYENRIKGESGSVSAAIGAISNAARNLSELRQNFYQKANSRGFCDDFRVAQSFCRLAVTTKSKIGGGLRVKSIEIKDEWDTATGTGGMLKGIYGQRYEYTTTDDLGRKISSGVASYEPSVGNDENGLRTPVPYVQKIKGSINNYFELEAPFGESLYPAPGVAYSKVTVKDIDPDAGNSLPRTGYTQHEFYTAKEFPVRVSISAMQKYNPRPQNTYSLVISNSIEELVLSQGYCIELNDMQGKPKAERVFNASGAEISSTEYEYQVEDKNAPVKRLDNRVTVIQKNGTAVDNTVIGRDIELFTDLREQESINNGSAINLGVDMLPFLGAPVIPIPHFPVNVNNDYKLFRSACAVKVIQTNGLIKRVTKTENGSSISVENVAYDGVTGDPIITKTQNEFKKDYYSINIPAYWPYQKMGGAYQNQGMVLKNVNLNGYSEINDSYWDLLTQGDELVNLGTGIHYWVVDNRSEIYLGQIGAYLYEPTKILVDKKGSRLSSITGGEMNHSFKVIRSGFRNLLAAQAESIVCINNPIVNGKLAFSNSQDLGSLKVINASAMTYSDEWPVDGRGQETERKENTARTFTYRLSPGNIVHGMQGSRIYNICDESVEGGPLTNCDQYVSFSGNSYFNHRQDAVGIWPDITQPGVNESLGFTTKFYAPATKLYFIGFAGDDLLNIALNGNEVITSALNNTDYWSLYPVWMEEGMNTIEVSGYNVSNGYNDWGNNPGSMAVEIYDNTYAQLRNSTSSSGINTIFSTYNLLADQSNFQTFRTIDGLKTWRFTYETYFNPFVHGLKGNWRLYTQEVHQVNRAYNNIFTPGKKGIDIANAGYLKSFRSYWIREGSVDWTLNNQISQWERSNRVTQYDKYGQEEENVDALKRYSAACFDFSGQFPAAVASNSMRREIYVNSFEDKARILSAPDPAATKEFTTSYGYGLYYDRAYSVAHSGNYSLLVPAAGIKLDTRYHTTKQKEQNYLGRTNKMEFTLLEGNGLYPGGFEPEPGKEYILSMWVNDGQPYNRNVSVVVNAGNTNGNPLVDMNCKAIVEGWKQLEGRFTPFSNGNKKFTISIAPATGTLYLDDIRIHPKDAMMKSYAYDDRNFRLMAELDENCFATFYEYDDEGSLVRVKKETERGIATIKENHSSYRKR